MLNWRLLLQVLAIVTALIVVGAWLVLFPTPRFPAPTGAMGIGTRVYYWTDGTRLEPFTAARGDPRRLVVQVWYPSSGTGLNQPYIDRLEVLAAIARRLRIPPFLLRKLQDAPTHAVRDGRPAGGQHPVLVNPTGFSGFRTSSLFWIEDLVSHGYVVVTLDQPGTAAASVWSDGVVTPLIADKNTFDRYMPLARSGPSERAIEMNGVALPGGIIPFLANDLSFVLDQLELVNQSDPILAGTLDLEHVGVFGMSLGGYIAPEACHRDPRFKACLAVDSGKSEVVAQLGLDQPVMIIGRDADTMRSERRKAGGWPDAEINHTIDSQRAIFDHNRGDAYSVTMKGMHHLNWTDAPILSPLVRWSGLAGPIDPYLGFTLTNDCTRSFFDRYLKAARATQVCGDSNAEPSVQIKIRLADPRQSSFRSLPAPATAPTLAYARTDPTRRRHEKGSVGP